MANGHEHWWDTVLRLGEGAIAAIAAAASASMGWMIHRYRRDRTMLIEHEKYVNALKRQRVLSKIKEHHRTLRKLDKQLSETRHLADLLDDQTKALDNVAKSLQSSIVNLTTLVEKRGKEHHELRDVLQPMMTRISILEEKQKMAEK